MIHVSRPFKIKHATLPLFVIHATTLDLTQFEEHLQAHLAQDPGFFAGSPIALSLEAIDGAQATPDFDALTHLLHQHDVRLAGVVGGTEQQRRAALRSGLAVFPQTTVPVPSTLEIPSAIAGAPRVDTTAQASAPTAPATEPGPLPATIVDDHTPPGKRHRYQTLVIDRPIRTGQRIQADGCDLVVLAAVNPGAELIADGNIHIYAPLRGRALAGARGDESARIFVQQLDAELVSIAGYFKVFADGIPAPLRRAPVQILLDGEEVRVQRL